jgi:hypothetical protein
VIKLLQNYHFSIILLSGVVINRANFKQTINDNLKDSSSKEFSMPLKELHL